MVKIDKFSLRYEAEKILKDISLTIGDGECILLTGKSGSGKSSIINSINGLATRYENAEICGEIMVDEKNISDMELYQISMVISTVFQNPKTYFFNVNTTLELLFYLENIGMSKEGMEKRIDEMLELFPISELLGRDIFKLSGGEKQILCIAACYIAGTKVIVMDEPSSNLDQSSIEIVRNMLHKLKSKGVSLIIAEHRIYYLMDLIDSVYLIDEGMISHKYSGREFAELSVSELNSLGMRDKNRTQLNVPLNCGKGDLQIRKLEYQFKDLHKSLRFSDLNFKLGKIYGIVGSNGHGKSTLLRCLIGVEKSSKEDIFFQGKKLSKRQRIKMSSLVMQDVNHQLFTDDVYKELSLGVKNFNKVDAENILKDLDLFKVKDRHPMSLSGGQKQRVAIATVLCQQSPFIFFDEPTSGMDYVNMTRIAILLKKLRSDDRIIFVVSHDMEFLNEVADAVLML